MDQDQLEQALKAAAYGSQDAWRDIVEEYSGRVYGLILRSCGDRELAEEITQDTFAKLVRKLHGYSERGKFEPWLFRIAMNRLRDEMRRRKRHAVPVAFNETPPESIGFYKDPAASTSERPDFRIESREQVAALKAAVSDLSEADQQVLHLRYTAGLGFKEIATTLNQPLGTVLARGHRALKKLREKLVDEAEK